MPRFATIDIGTNSVLLLVAGRRPDGGFDPLVDQAEITRLGRGVDATGTLSEQSMEDTLRVLEQYAATARDQGAQEIAVTATSAARDAKNGAHFIAEAKRRAGLNLEIISGDAEAQLSYLAVQTSYGGAADALVVLDIGGGSTEFIYGGRGAEASQVRFRRSFDVGAVRMTERFVHSDPVTEADQRAVVNHLRQTFAQAPEPPEGSTAVGVAGTVTTLFAVQHGIARYDASLVEGQTLAMEEVRALRKRLCAMPLAQRKQLPGLQPKRADVVCAGAMILECAMERLKTDRLVVSDRGLRWGLMVSRFGGRS